MNISYEFEYTLYCGIWVCMLTGSVCVSSRLVCSVSVDVELSYRVYRHWCSVMVA